MVASGSYFVNTAMTSGRSPRGQPTRIEVVVCLITARALVLKDWQSVLMRADEVIQ